MADEDERDGTGGAAVDVVPTAIVGVGVGAASLPSLAALFAGVAPDTEAAFLLAAHQREAPDPDAVREALGHVCALPVSVAADGDRVAPGHVYLTGAGDLVTVEDGRVRVRRPDDPAGGRGAIDTLLVSLAEHAHERAVAVLLGGLGSEGAAGMVATKKFGGLSIAERDGRDDAAAAGGSNPAAVADLHVPADRIGAEIARYLRSLGPILQEEEREEVAGDLEAHVTQIATILRNVTSHDFHGYKRGTFIRRVQRRMQVMQVEGGMDAYVERLRADREEGQLLFQDLLIGVTQFFRDPAEFDALERELPRLFAGKGAGDQFRVWVLGCATGEEAYSIAMLLREHMATLDHPPEVQIFATDLDARALSLARAGRYADAIAKHVRPDRLQRWFTREGDTYCVSKELREMCIFSPHNIVKDAPFSRTDILSCRNLLIYLSTDLQNRVIPIFHFSLRPDGVLFLGSSENVTRHGKLFAPVDRKSRVFRRLETATRIIPDFPLTPRLRGGEPTAAPAGPAPFEARLPASVSRQAEAVAERYAPAYVIVDIHGDVLHFSGRTGRYLEPSAGAASLNLANLVHRDLRLDVRTALGRAVAEARRVELPRLTFRQDDRASAVTVVVEPLSAGDVTSLVVVFQDLGPLPEGSVDDGRLTTDEHVQRLEAELRITRDRLQATIEELESTNEELKSSNEEYQSINEELQSANEEMETSKEELQSVNEELQTVNGELAHRVQDLGRANSDMKNLLESTQIATLFLDNSLRIRNFTPAATDVFHLLETDIGRPLDHVVSRVRYPELVEDVRRVLKTLVPVERQVSDAAENRHFSARVLPYRSVDNYISGAVITFTDLTAVRQAEAALRESEESYRTLFDSIDEGFAEIDLITDEQGRVVDWLYLKLNPALTRLTGIADVTGRRISEILPELEATWAERYTRLLKTGEPVRFEEYAASIDLWLDVYAALVGGEGSRRVVLVYNNITARKRADTILRESEERQSFLLQFSDALRPLDDPEDIRLTAAQVLGRHLGANRVAYAENVDDEVYEVARNYVDGAKEFTGRFPYAEYGADILSELRSGRNRVQPDIANDARLSDREKRALADAEIGASLNVPLVKSGRLVAFLGVNFAAAHDFTAAEIALVTDVAERTWAAVERARAEAALGESEERFRRFGEASQDVLWIRNAETFQWEYLTPAFETIYGLDRDAALSGDDLANWLDLIEPEDRERAVANLRRVRDGEWVTFEYRIRRPSDGRVRWLRNTDFPIRDASGEVVRLGGIGHDVTDAKDVEDRQRVLVTELQHRTFNLMGVVRSMADATVRSSADLDEFRAKFRDRIDSLARVQRLLSQLREGDRVTFDELIRSELAAAGASGGEDGRVTLDGPVGVTLRSGTVQTLAMAMHELTTNALKYGALSQPEARLDVRWRVEDGGNGEPWLHVAWTETGVAMPPAGAAPEGTGQGRTLIEEALPYQLHARTTYELAADGVRCTIALPASRRNGGDADRG